MSAEDPKEPEYAVAMDEEEVEEENEHATSGGGPRTPVDDAASELNASLDISGSTEPSDGEESQADRSHNTTGISEQCDTTATEVEAGAEADAEAEAEQEPEPVRPPRRMGDDHSPVSPAEEGEESSSTSSSSSGEQSDSETSRSEEGSDDDSEASPTTVVDVSEMTANNDSSGGTPADNEESVTESIAEPAEDAAEAAVVDTEAAQVDEKLPAEVEMQGEVEAETETEVATEVEAAMEPDTEMQTATQAEAPTEDVPETPASPTDDGEEPIDLMPMKTPQRLLFDSVEQKRLCDALMQRHQYQLPHLQQHLQQLRQSQPSRMAPRDPRQKQEASYLMLDGYESISDTSDEGNSSDETNSSEEANTSEDDDVIIVEPDSGSHDTVTATETTDAEGDSLQHKIEINNPQKKYYIRRTDGTVHAGHVLHSRVTDNCISPNEYYVHYVGLNRRLDEWVGRHRISDNPDDLGGITVTTPPAEILSDQPSTSASALALANATALASASGTTGQPNVGTVIRPKRQRIKDYYLSEQLGDNNRYDYSDRKMTRYQKRRYDEINHVQKSHTELSASQAALEEEHERITKIKYIEKLRFGNYEIGTWYYSPFPDEYRWARVLYVCEYCLKYMRLERSYRYHLYTCQKRSPPGREIYQKGTISIFEVNGKEEPLYCQLLCLMAKMFLDHKVLYFDMDPFYFYVLCETDKMGRHIVGYFSKEKKSQDNYNVACILVLPPHQRKGYGKLLIAFSYELSRKEGVIGSPEKPLSDMGRLSYRSYWAYTLLELMKGRCSAEHITIKELSEASGIMHDDIIYTLQSMKMIKYWKGQNVICVTAKMINDLLQLPQFKRPKLTIDPSCLNWKPHTPPPPMPEVWRNQRL